MKFIKILASLFLVLTVSSAYAKKDKSEGLYMAGVSASFTDSLIYFTDIQFVDSVAYTSDGMLSSRAQYSEQLDNYLEYQKGMKNRTCFIYYNKKKSKLEKTIKKMKDKYLKGGKSVLKEVGPEFKFTKAIEY